MNHSTVRTFTFALAFSAAYLSNWDNPYDPPEDIEAPSDERLFVYVDHYTPAWINILEELREPSEKD